MQVFPGLEILPRTATTFYIQARGSHVNRFLSNDFQLNKLNITENHHYHRNRTVPFSLRMRL